VLFRREMISIPKTGPVVVGGHSSVQRSGHLPVRQLESLAADIAESDISILLAGVYCLQLRDREIDVEERADHERDYQR